MKESKAEKKLRLKTERDQQQQEAPVAQEPVAKAVEQPSSEGVKKQLSYKCDCCGVDFPSGRVRSGEKLCNVCIGLRRALHGFMKAGLTEAEVMKRSKQLLKA